MANKPKDTSRTPPDNKRLVIEAAFEQIVEEGKMTLDGVKERSGIGGRQTVVNYMDEARDEVVSRLRFLVEGTAKDAFPLEAIFVLKDWAMVTSEGILQRERESLDMARDAFEAERDDLRTEQTRLKDELRDLQHAHEATLVEAKSYRERTEADLEKHQQTIDALREANSQLEGRYAAEQANSADLAKQMASLKEIEKRAGELQSTIDQLKDQVNERDKQLSVANNTEQNLRERLRDEAQAHQHKEAAWLSHRDALRTELEAQLAEVGSQARDIENLQNENASLATRNTETTSALADQTHKTHKRDVELASVKARRDALMEDKTALTSQVERLTGEITKLNRHNSLLTDKLEALHSQLASKGRGKS